MKIAKTAYDVAIIGGGLAGLCNAIHLSRAGLKVVLLEKNGFPTHKVCGEYISNEVLPYLSWLGFDAFTHGATRISTFELGKKSGKPIQSKLPLGGFGISRFTIDAQLAKLAEQHGCVMLKDTVQACSFRSRYFEVRTKSEQNIEARFVIGAFGKRSNIDAVMNRDFMVKKSPYLGVKAHYTGDYPADKVGLYAFSGGYCGVSKVENDLINICYLTHYESFKKHKDLNAFEENVLFENEHLKSILTSCKMVFEKPLTISQISFSAKQSVQDHILMSGDAAGMIHPLCGNGMGMAIHSAMICSEQLLNHFDNPSFDRFMVEKAYAKAWQKIFRKRLLAGRFFNNFLSNEKRLGQAINSLMYLPSALPFLVRQTHGEPLVPPTRKFPSNG